MVKTRSRAAVSPRTPLSDKTKKVGRKVSDSPVASPSVKASKKRQSNKKNDEITKADVKEIEASASVIPAKVIDKAISELVKFASEHSEKPDKPSLFDDEEDGDNNNMFVQINTKKFYASKPQFKPKLIKLSLPIYDVQELKSCLILRDQAVTSNEQLEKIEAANIPTLSQIYTLSQVKSEFKNFEKRREFYSSYDLFLVDDALLSMMPTILGKIFYSNGFKVPLPIKTTSSGTKEFSISTVKNQVEKCINSTHFLPPMGVNIAVKFGRTNYDKKNLAANLNDVVSVFDLDSVKSIMVKTTISPSLPLFYTENLYDDKDVAENVSKNEKSNDNGVKLTKFEQGLLELGDPDEVNKIIGKKLKKQSKANKKEKKSVGNSKVSKK